MRKWKVMFCTLFILMLSVTCFAEPDLKEISSAEGLFAHIAIDVNSITAKSFNGDDIVEFIVDDLDNYDNIRNVQITIAWVDRQNNTAMYRAQSLMMGGKKQFTNVYDPMYKSSWSYIEDKPYALDGYQYIVDNGLLP